jgi:CTP:phosphocholine cytidylyltransferase-like protein
MFDNLINDESVVKVIILAAGKGKRLHSEEAQIPKHMRKILGKPILYEYAQISGQIITVPSKLLQTKDTVRSTDNVIVIRGYLLRKIEWIRNEKSRRSDNIMYHDIYEELGITRNFYNDGMYKKKTHAVRTHVKSILDEWQEQGYVKSYEQYKEKTIIKGVKIRI